MRCEKCYVRIYLNGDVISITEIVSVIGGELISVGRMLSLAIGRQRMISAIGLPMSGTILSPTPKARPLKAHG